MLCHYSGCNREATFIFHFSALAFVSSVRLQTHNQYLQDLKADRLRSRSKCVRRFRETTGAGPLNAVCQCQGLCVQVKWTHSPNDGIFEDFWKCPCVIHLHSSIYLQNFPELAHPCAQNCQWIQMCVTFIFLLSWFYIYL